MNTMTERCIAASQLVTEPQADVDNNNTTEPEPTHTTPKPTEVVADAPADQGTDGPSTDQSQG